MLDDTTATAKTVNSFKTRLEMERKMKMGLFLDWSPLDHEAITDIRSDHPASILQVLGAIKCGKAKNLRIVWWQMLSNSSNTTHQSSGKGVAFETRRLRVRFLAGMTNTVLGWVTIFGRANHLSISPSHPSQLSLLPSAGWEMSTSQSAACCAAGG